MIDEDDINNTSELVREKKFNEYEPTKVNIDIVDRIVIPPPIISEDQVSKDYPMRNSSSRFLKKWSIHVNDKVMEVDEEASILNNIRMSIGSKDAPGLPQQNSNISSEGGIYVNEEELI